MKNKYSKDELRYMINFISDYITEIECNDIIEGNNMDCENCSCIDDCYSMANDKCNSEFAESIGYDGCNSEKDFWEQLFN